MTKVSTENENKHLETFIAISNYHDNIIAFYYNVSISLKIKSKTNQKMAIFTGSLRNTIRQEYTLFKNNMKEL